MGILPGLFLFKQPSYLVNPPSSSYRSSEIYNKSNTACHQRRLSERFSRCLLSTSAPLVPDHRYFAYRTDVGGRGGTIGGEDTTAPMRLHLPNDPQSFSRGSIGRPLSRETVNVALSRATVSRFPTDFLRSVDCSTRSFRRVTLRYVLFRVAPIDRRYREKKSFAGSARNRGDDRGSAWRCFYGTAIRRVWSYGGLRSSPLSRNRKLMQRIAGTGYLTPGVICKCRGRLAPRRNEEENGRSPLSSFRSPSLSLSLSSARTISPGSRRLPFRSVSYLASRSSIHSSPWKRRRTATAEKRDEEGRTDAPL